MHVSCLPLLMDTVFLTVFLIIVANELCRTGRSGAKIFSRCERRRCRLAGELERRLDRGKGVARRQVHYE